MRVPVVELSECIQCLVCAEVYPAVFKWNDAGYIEVIDRPDYPEKEVDDAIRNCPVDCIYWNDE